MELFFSKPIFFKLRVSSCTRVPLILLLSLEILRTAIRNKGKWKFLVALRQRKKAFKITILCGFLHQKLIKYFTLKAKTAVRTIEFIRIRVSLIRQLNIVMVIRVIYCSLERLVPVLSGKLSSYNFQWLPQLRIVGGSWLRSPIGLSNSAIGW